MEMEFCGRYARTGKISVFSYFRPSLLGRILHYPFELLPYGLAHHGKRLEAVGRALPPSPYPLRERHRDMIVLVTGRAGGRRIRGLELERRAGGSGKLSPLSARLYSKLDGGWVPTANDAASRTPKAIFVIVDMKKCLGSCVVY